MAKKRGRKSSLKSYAGLKNEYSPWATAHLREEVKKYRRNDKKNV